MVFSHLIRFPFSPSSNMLSTYQGGTSFKREMEVIYFPTIMSSCRYDNRKLWARMVIMIVVSDSWFGPRINAMINFINFFCFKSTFKRYLTIWFGKKLNPLNFFFIYFNILRKVRHKKVLLNWQKKDFRFFTRHKFLFCLWWVKAFNLSHNKNLHLDLDLQRNFLTYCWFLPHTLRITHLNENVLQINIFLKYLYLRIPIISYFLSNRSSYITLRSFGIYFFVGYHGF